MRGGKQGAQQVKDNGFDARFIFVQPPPVEAVEARLKEAGMGEEEIRKTVKAAAEAAEEARSGGLYGSVVEAELKALESVIFAPERGVADAASADGDVVMGDRAPS